MELLKALVNRIRDDPSAASTCTSLIAQHGIFCIDAVEGDDSNAGEQIDRAVQTANELLSKAEVCQWLAQAAAPSVLPLPC